MRCVTRNTKFDYIPTADDPSTVVTPGEFLNIIGKMKDEYDEKIEFLASEILRLQERVVSTEFALQTLIVRLED